MTTSCKVSTSCGGTSGGISSEHGSTSCGGETSSCGGGSLVSVNNVLNHDLNNDFSNNQILSHNFDGNNGSFNTILGLI